MQIPSDGKQQSPRAAEFRQHNVWRAALRAMESLPWHRAFHLQEPITFGSLDALAETMTAVYGGARITPARAGRAVRGLGLRTVRLTNKAAGVLGRYVVLHDPVAIEAARPRYKLPPSQGAPFKQRSALAGIVAAARDTLQWHEARRHGQRIYYLAVSEVREFSAMANGSQLPQATNRAIAQAARDELELPTYRRGTGVRIILGGADQNLADLSPARILPGLRGLPTATTEPKKSRVGCRPGACLPLHSDVELTWPSGSAGNATAPDGGGGMDGAADLEASRRRIIAEPFEISRAISAGR